MNQLSALQRGHLQLALAHLVNRDAARYRHQLWIGFGDNWPALERKLMAAGLVRESEAAACDRRITAEGRRVIGMLEESIVAA